MSWNPDQDKCVCGHTRRVHEADADFRDGRMIGEWGRCEECSCQRFEEE